MRVRTLGATIVLAISLVAGFLIFSLPASAFSADIADGLSGWLSEFAAMPSVTAALEWVGEQYRNAPALVLGFIAFLIAPFLVAIGGIARWLSRGTKRSYAGNGETHAIESQEEAGERTRLEQMAPGTAWIELSKGAGSKTHDRIPVTNASILRLGREPDNDITLEDKSVHRYHAAIHRSAQTGFLITDLSSAKGNGVLVNGRRVGERWLKDGDRITLGRAEMTFHTSPMT